MRRFYDFYFVTVFGCGTSSPKRMCTAAYRRPRLTGAARFSGFYRLGGVALRKHLRVFGATCRSYRNDLFDFRRSPESPCRQVLRNKSPRLRVDTFFGFSFFRDADNWTMTSKHSYWHTRYVYYYYMPRKKPLKKSDRRLVDSTISIGRTAGLIFFNYLICSASPSPAVISRADSTRRGDVRPRFFVRYKL